MIKQEQILRKVTPIGNGAHIFAPKEWIGEQVFIVRTLEKSLKEKVLSVLKPHLEYIEGAYLYGSRARGEENKYSDVDLLLITTKKLKLKKQGYEIIAIEKEKIPKAVKIEPIMIYSALSEAKPIINAKLLKELRAKYNPILSDFNGFIEETKRMLSVNKEFLELDKKKGEFSDSDSVPYSLILRLRGIFIMKSLLSEKIYSKKKFDAWISKNISDIDYDSIYRSYLIIKNNSKIKNLKIKVKDLFALHDFLKEEIKKLEDKVNTHGKKKKGRKQKK